MRRDEADEAPDCVPECGDRSLREGRSRVAGAEPSRRRTSGNTPTKAPRVIDARLVARYRLIPAVTSIDEAALSEPLLEPSNEVADAADQPQGRP